MKALARAAAPRPSRLAFPWLWWVANSLVATGTGCATAGSRWVAEPLTAEGEISEPNWRGEPGAVPPFQKKTARIIGAGPAEPRAGTADEAEPRAAATGLPRDAAGGHSLGTFRNTYYDFPREEDFDGTAVALKNSRCETIRHVPRAFFESLCVQGSGKLSSGATVSFSKRGCGCAENCPRTDQRICFDVLDPKRFPWGRGATGKAITPLITVAVDTEVIPLGTPVYVPELDGIAGDPQGTSVHDGCLVAQDRGLRVKGKHLDIFTGSAPVTQLWNRLLPSNQGITVILDSPRCPRAE